MSDRENTENKLLTPTLILPPQGGGKRKIDSLVRRNDRGNNGNDIRGIGDDPGEVRPHEAIKLNYSKLSSNCSALNLLWISQG